MIINAWSIVTCLVKPCINVGTVRRGSFIECVTPRRVIACGDGRGEYEPLEIEVSAFFKDIAETVDVGSLIIGVILAGEIVVGCQVDDVVGAAPFPNCGKGLGDEVPVADVHLEPSDVVVDRRPASFLGSARQRNYLEIVLETIKNVSADKSRGAGDNKTG